MLIDREEEGVFDFYPQDRLLSKVFLPPKIALVELLGINPLPMKTHKKINIHKNMPRREKLAQK